MGSYSKNDIILVRYPFSDLSGSKVRPAIVVSVPHVFQDVFIVPLSSKTTALLTGSFCSRIGTLLGLMCRRRLKEVCLQYISL
jgi:mRNA interferase MazF